eukprot:505667_1
MSSVLSFVDDLSTISLIVLSFAFLSLILIIIFLLIISERICPLFCLCCCSNNCHNTCSSKIHRLSDTYYISRKQLSLKIQGSSTLNHLSLNSTSVTSYATTISNNSHSTKPSLNINIQSEQQLELQHVTNTQKQKQKQQHIKPKLQQRHTMPLQPISNLNKSTNNNNNNKYIECETHTPVPLSPDSPIQSDIELSDSTIDLYLDTIK